MNTAHSQYWPSTLDVARCVLRLRKVYHLGFSPHRQQLRPHPVASSHHQKRVCLLHNTHRVYCCLERKCQRHFIVTYTHGCRDFECRPANTNTRFGADGPRRKTTIKPRKRWRASHVMWLSRLRFFALLIIFLLYAGE